MLNTESSYKHWDVGPPNSSLSELLFTRFIDARYGGSDCHDRSLVTVTPRRSIPPALHQSSELLSGAHTSSSQPYSRVLAYQATAGCSQPRLQPAPCPSRRDHRGA